MISNLHISRFAKMTALALFIATTLTVVGSNTPAEAQSRIKDIVAIEGVRDNLLVGYGLVVGLNGSGDTLANAPFTTQSLVGMLERLGVNTRNDIDSLNTANVAAVMVTSTLPAFARQGSRIDISVSALGDATSLRGGTLLVTPMLGADGEVYSVAQGPLVVEGFSAQGNAQTIIKGVPTTARIPSGAIVEREIMFDLAALTKVHLNLRNPDFTTSQRIAQSINGLLGGNSASVLDPATVRVDVPAAFAGNTIGMLTEIEQLQVTPDQVARVVIAEHSGVIVMGQDVKISTVAIAQGNLTIKITETPQVSQPNAFASQGTTTTVDRSNIEIDEDSDKRLAVLDPGITLQELVNGLNALGIGPRDMISILQTIKAAGALQAEIEVI
ncbi:MAG: flagellar basal body P-ring protein FlgI [Proteobacteria bacterium]|nr:flagellar basal body P-ring protein FlgI [Pseudomonadota bacterium]